MNETIPLALKKPSGAGKERVFQTLNSELTHLPLGGHEGQKFTLKIDNPLKKADGTPAEPLYFVVKELIEKSEPELEQLSRAYRILQDKGYPVPLTVRSFQREGKNYLAASDMTEGGKYWIWGFNDDASPEEADELRAMQLSAVEVAELKSQVAKIADQAVRDTLNMDGYWYHIRKNKETGKVDVVILDIYPNFLFLKYMVAADSPKQVKLFESNLDEALQEVS